jgi:hypothetical protein
LASCSKENIKPETQTNKIENVHAITTSGPYEGVRIVGVENNCLKTTYVNCAVLPEVVVYPSWYTNLEMTKSEVYAYFNSDASAPIKDNLNDNVVDMLMSGDYAMTLIEETTSTKTFAFSNGRNEFYITL